MRRIVLTLAFCLLLSLTPVAVAEPIDPFDGNGESDMEVAGVCVWGWSDDCMIAASECFQPYRPMFGIGCI